MKIGIDARMIRVTGIGRYIEQLTVALVEVGQDVTPILQPRDVAWWQENHPGIEHLSAPEPIYSWREQLSFPARLRAERFDVVHFGNFNVPFTWSRPAVVTLHDLTPLAFAGERRRGFTVRRAYRAVLANALGKNKHVIVPSQSVAGTIKRDYQPASLNVIPHALSQVFFSDPTSTVVRAEFCRKHDISKPYVLYVGNMRQHKNVETLIKAFAEFSKGVSAQLVLAGPVESSHTAQLQMLVGKLEIQQAVRWTDALSVEELLAAYDGARLLVHPSRAEGFGFTPLEAAARRVPTIVSSAVPTRALLGRGVVSFDPANTEELSSLISIVWADPHMRAQLVTRARSIAAVRTWKDVAQETVEVYKTFKTHSVKS